MSADFRIEQKEKLESLGIIDIIHKPLTEEKIRSLISNPVIS